MNDSPKDYVPLLNIAMRHNLFVKTLIVKAKAAGVPVRFFMRNGYKYAAIHQNHETQLLNQLGFDPMEDKVAAFKRERERIDAKFKNSRLRYQDVQETKI